MAKKLKEVGELWRIERRREAGTTVYGRKMHIPHIYNIFQHLFSVFFPPPMYRYTPYGTGTMHTWIIMRRTVDCTFLSMKGALINKHIGYRFHLAVKLRDVVTQREQSDKSVIRATNLILHKNQQDNTKIGVRKNSKTYSSATPSSKFPAFV